jgi:hypothetical protein
MVTEGEKWNAKGRDKSKGKGKGKVMEWVRWQWIPRRWREQSEKKWNTYKYVNIYI